MVNAFEDEMPWASSAELPMTDEAMAKALADYITLWWSENDPDAATPTERALSVLSAIRAEATRAEQERCAKVMALIKDRCQDGSHVSRQILKIIDGGAAAIRARTVAS